MSWLKVDDRAFGDPRFNRVSRDARLLHIEALAMSMGYEGDGAVTRYSLRRSTDAADPDALAAELVAAGLWDATDDGWQVVFMLDDQMKPDEIARQKEFNRTRQERHRRHSRDDHSLCDPRFCRVAASDGSNASRNASRNASVTVPRPGPTRPKEGKGRLAPRSSGPAAPPPAPLAGDITPAYFDIGGFQQKDDQVMETARRQRLDPSNFGVCSICGAMGNVNDEADPWDSAALVAVPDADDQGDGYGMVHVRCAAHPAVIERGV